MTYIRADRGRVAVFRTEQQLYLADTCEPLKRAALAGDIKLRARGRAAYPGPAFSEKMLPEVRSTGCWEARNRQQWGLNWHRNEGIEFTFLALGRLSFATEANKFNLQRGDFTITRPWQLHCVGDPNVEASKLYWLIIDVGVRRPNQPWKWPRWLCLTREDVERLTELLSQNENPAWRGNRSIEACFERIILSCQDSVNESKLRLSINELLLAIKDALEDHGIELDKDLVSTERAVQLFLDALGERLDEPWTLSSMAKEYGLSRTRFAHYCKLTTGMSPMDVLKNKRVEHAKQLLATRSDLSITDVAYHCGFSSSQYFDRVFKNMTQASPRSFRSARTAGKSGTDHAIFDEADHGM